MSTATNGRAREYRVAADLERHGFRLLMRAAGSKGSADIAVVSKVAGLALVQVGTRNKRLGPAQRLRLCEDAADAGALALLAVTHPGVGVRYWRVTMAVPGSWVEYKPGDEE